MIKQIKASNVAICWDSSYVYVHVPVENKERGTWIHCLMLCCFVSSDDYSSYNI